MSKKKLEAAKLAVKKAKEALKKLQKGSKTAKPKTPGPKKKKKKRVKKKNPPFVLDTMGDVKPGGKGILIGGGVGAAGAGVAGVRSNKPIERKKRGGRVR
jgi:hypothetical protein